MKKTPKYLLVVVTILVAVSMLLAACGEAATPTPTKGAEATKAPAAATTAPGAATPTKAAAAATQAPATPGGDINVGVVTVLTGAYAAYGKDFLVGAQIAADWVNAKGGVVVAGKSYNLKVQQADFENKGDLAVSESRRLKSQFSTPLIMSPGSNSAVPMAAIADTEKFINVGLSSLADFKCEMCVRTYILTTDEIPVQVDYALSKGLKKVGVFIFSTETVEAWTQQFKPIWTQKGGEYVGDVKAGAGETNLGPALNTLLGKGAIDVIAVGGSSDEQVALVVNQARELGYKGKFMFSGSTAGPTLVKLTGDKCEGTILVSNAFATDDPRITAYKAEYAKRNAGADPRWTGGIAYEVVRAYAKALPVAGSKDDLKATIAAFKKVMPLGDEGLGLFSGVSSTSNDWVTNVIPAEIENGKVVPKPVKK